MRISSNQIDKEINTAQTLPSIYYSDHSMFEKIKEKVFPRTWQLVGDKNIVKIPGQLMPLNLLENTLNEPILFTRDFDDKIHCISNVCTHRGSILVTNGANEKQIRCRYHGRRFNLAGKFQFMPEMEDAKNFPSESDNLVNIPFRKWRQFLFVSLDPVIDFDQFIRNIDDRIGWLPIDSFEYCDSKIATANSITRLVSLKLIKAKKVYNQESNRYESLYLITNSASGKGPP